MQSEGLKGECWANVADGAGWRFGISGIFMVNELIDGRKEYIVYDTIIWRACFSSISPSFLNQFSRNFA